MSSLQTDDMIGSSHVHVETHIDTDGTELLRLLYQDHLSLRAEREESHSMTGADGETRVEVRHGQRDLMSPFGGVVVRRIALAKRGVSGGLRPMDAWLNLPPDSFSLVVRRDIAWAAANGSFESAVGDVVRLTGAIGPGPWHRTGRPGPRSAGSPLGLFDGHAVRVGFDGEDFLELPT